MSVSNHDPNSFVSWLDRHHPNENREYVPRFFYGEYLKRLRAEVEAIGFPFFNIECDVKSLVKKNDGYAVEFQDARGEQVSIEVDQVVLALGAIVPGNPYDLVNDGDTFRMFIRCQIELTRAPARKDRSSTWVWPQRL